jgi:hypothetical protein
MATDEHTLNQITIKKQEMHTKPFLESHNY